MSLEIKPRLIVFNDFFYPAYQAGGPIQSLVNLFSQVSKNYEIFLITGAYDLNDKTPLDVPLDQWTDIVLPESESNIKVWYSSTHKIKKVFIDSLRTINPAAVYVNGMFSVGYVLVPIFYTKNTKLVICPRGMIQEGALAGKYLKKKVYLTLLRLSGKLKKVCWHATSDIEKGDVKRIFGIDSNIVFASNVPKPYWKKIESSNKKVNSLRLVYISLITAKKNLLLAIEALNASDFDICLDIYGPVKDVDYWEKCKLMISHSNGKINYKGDLKPDLVQSTFSQYDAGLFLTKAENFGHALYESLSVGRPIITSHFTPWKNLQNQKAGWNVDINNANKITCLLEEIAKMNKSDFDDYSFGAHRLAKHYFENEVNLIAYNQLFSKK